MIVLDTGALLAYVHGDPRVGIALADLGDTGEGAVIAGTCLIEAYARLHFTQFEMLAVLRAHPAVTASNPVVDPGGIDDLPFIGGMAARAGTLGAGHCGYLALSHGAVVFTARPEQIRAVVGEQWPIVEVSP